MIWRRISTVATILIGSASICLAQQLLTVAVLEFEGLGISQIESAVVSSRLRTAIVEAGKVTLVERGAMEQILTEQDFQLSGYTSNECAVEVGRLLNVSFMLAGTIGKIGSLYTIDTRIVDIETGSVTSTLSRDYTGSIEGLIGEIKLLAQSISIEMGGSSISASEPPETTQSTTGQTLTTATPPSAADSPPTITLPLEAIVAEEVRAANIRGSIEWLDRPPPSLFQRHPAQPRGGYSVIKSNIRYPLVARSQGIEGNVLLACYIDETGNFTKVSVLKSMPGGLDEAAVAAIQKTSFDPAYNDWGDLIASWLPVPVFFKLDGIE